MQAACLETMYICHHLCIKVGAPGFVRIMKIYLYEIIEAGNLQKLVVYENVLVYSSCLVAAMGGIMF